MFLCIEEDPLPVWLQQVAKMKLTTHFNDAHKDHQCCVECQIIVKGTKGLCCSKALKKHITTVHQTSNHKGQSKVLLCPHCGEAFQRRTTYEAHINQAWSLTHLTCFTLWEWCFFRFSTQFKDSQMIFRIFEPNPKNGKFEIELFPKFVKIFSNFQKVDKHFKLK